MSASHSKAVADHEGDLSSSWKPVLLLGFVLLVTDFLLEVGVLDDLVQCRSNIRVQLLKRLDNSFQLPIARIFDAMQPS